MSTQAIMVKYLNYIEKTALFLALLALFGVAASQVYSFDIFWQLQSGRYILQTGSFIYTDTFSLASDVFRYEHCWLHDILFYGAYLLGGYAGISLLKGGLVVATVGMLVFTAFRRGSSTIAILLVSFPLILTTYWAWKDRPQLWSYVIFALFVFLLDDHRQHGGRKIFLLVPLMIVWTNLHAASILAFPVVGAYLVGNILDKKQLIAGKKVFITLVLIVLASFLNPYGFFIIDVLIATPTLGPQESIRFNMDWNAPILAQEPYFVGALVFLVIWILWQRKNISFCELFLLLGLAFMGFKMKRHIPFFIFAGAAILPRYLDHIGERLCIIFKVRKEKVLRGLILLASICFLTFEMTPLVRQFGFFNLKLAENHYAVGAARFVKEQRLPANLFNSYSLGGYLMWELFPDYLVFWDGRSSSSKMFHAGKVIQYAESGWRDYLAEYDVRTMILKPLGEEHGNRFGILDVLRTDRAWSLVYADESALVFVRNDSVDPLWLRQFRLPVTRIDDTILSAARYLLSNNGGAYKALGEVANVHMARGQLRAAYEALGYYLTYSPEVDIPAQRYYEQLKIRFSGEN